MSDQSKKYESPKSPLKVMPGTEEQSLAEARHTRDDAAAADKSKRESGKDKEHHKR